MKAVLLSGNRFGYELMKEMRYKVKVVGIFIQSEKTKLWDRVPLEKWKRFNIPLVVTDSIDGNWETLKKLKPDYILVAGWRHIISEPLLSEFKFIGFHPTLLPFGRGRAPIINTILKNHKESGVTMFFLNEKTDAGDIIDSEKFTIEKNDHADDVYEKAIKAGQSLIRKNFPLNNPKRFLQQKWLIVNFDDPRKHQEIKEGDSIETIHRKVKAFSKPYDGAYIEEHGKKLRIWRTEL